jgi:septum formation protein
MTPELILASGSSIRAALLRQAGLQPQVRPVRVDEQAIRAALLAEGAAPRDIADHLAETKALRMRDCGAALVLGADQILDCDGELYAKPDSAQMAADQLRRLSGRTHRLHSAVVVCSNGLPLWRHVGTVRLTMHPLTDGFIAAYVDRNWASIRDAVGCYKLEEEGVRLFSRIEGDYFTILGLPMIELLTWLRARGDMPT